MLEPGTEYQSNGFDGSNAVRRIATATSSSSDDALSTAMLAPGTEYRFNDFVGSYEICVRGVGVGETISGHLRLLVAILPVGAVNSCLDPS
ncbi:hypothetical protein DYB35_011056 [Aphanomyces astaci]|uniref:Uncharacterized protein n=1 Tax=Aphanomyces astaci TaxID=112090 RepID=A0A3R7EFZ6_APHAT|nr:hypothetical protein DYB35_011056 [Aphanomyces astaci]